MVIFDVVPIGAKIMASMTEEKHKERHELLHRNLDELFADFIAHGNGGTRSSILELIEWSYKQTNNPDHPSNM